MVNKRQLIEFRDILAKYDNTFSVVETVNEIYGNFVNVKKDENWVKKTLEKNTFSVVETVNEIYGNFVNVKKDENWVKKTLEKAEKVIGVKGEEKPAEQKPTQ